MSQRQPEPTAEPDTNIEAHIQSIRAFLARYPTRRESPAGGTHAASAGPAPSTPGPDANASEPPAQAPETPRHEEPAASHPAPHNLFQEQGRVDARGALWQHRWRFVAAIALLVAGARLVSLFASGATDTGTLVVETSPAGVPVRIDGDPHGLTPLRVTLAPGHHSIDLAYGSIHRAVPVTITAGSQMSQFIELPRAIPALGELEIRTDPAGASVTVDGRLVGRAPLTVPNLVPGSHTVALRRDGRSLTERVLIESGRTTALVVPMAGASTGTAGAAASAGWLSVRAPAEVQIYENQQLLGTSRVDRIMVPVGRHELDLANDALGYRERLSVQVAAGEVAALTLAWPKGTLAINAAPWADVFVDGEGVGETPIGGLTLPIGTHEVVVRHPQFGERRASATVRVGQPARVGIDMRRP